MILPTSTQEAMALGLEHYKDKDFIKQWKLRRAYFKQKLNEKIDKDEKLNGWDWFSVQMINETLATATGKENIGNLKMVLGE